MRSTGALVILFIVLVIGFIGCSGCSTFNSLVDLDEQVERSWADVETQYQRRADLIPNLVNTVEGAVDAERETLTEVMEARARATSITLSADDLNDPAALQRFQEAQGALSGALSRLLAVSERYPELRSQERFADLQAQLEGTENRIATARRDYNGSVQQYNSRVRRFPAALFAGMFGFDRRVPFEAEAGADQAPDVNFN